MALLEGLEIYIPLEAEVHSVPLLSLPRSVLRKLGSPDPAHHSDSAHCVWISPALFQKKGQKETREGGARQHMLTVLGGAGGRRQGHDRGSSHWKMSFVTANTTAYSVLKETLPSGPPSQPPGPPLQPPRSPRVSQGPPGDSEQDAVIVHRGRIYLSVKRRGEGGHGLRQGGAQGRAQGPRSDHSQAAPQTRSQLKRKADALQDSAPPRVCGPPLTAHSSAQPAHSSPQPPRPAHSSPQQCGDPSYLLSLGHGAPADPRPSLTAGPDLSMAHSSPLTAHSSPLMAHSSPLTAHSSPLTAHSSPLTAHSSPLTAHSSPLPAHSCPPQCVDPSYVPPAPPHPSLVPVWAQAEPQDSDFQELQARERIAQMKKLLAKD